MATTTNPCGAPVEGQPHDREECYECDIMLSAEEFAKVGALCQPCAGLLNMTVKQTQPCKNCTAL